MTTSINPLYQHHRKVKRLGILREGEAEPKLNKINSDIIDLANKIGKEKSILMSGDSARQKEKSPETKNGSPLKKWGLYLLGALLLVALGIVAQKFTGDKKKKDVPPIVEDPVRQDTIGTIEFSGQAYSGKKMTDGNKWMTENLNIKMDGSWCYNEKIDKCKRYGRYYLWDAAQKVCDKMGDGWKLPTIYDWKDLAVAYGGFSSADFNTDGGNDPETAYDKLRLDMRLNNENTGKCTINEEGTRTWGAGMDNSSHVYTNLWSSTMSEKNELHGYFFRLSKTDRKILLAGYDKRWYALPCRCVNKNK